MADYIVNITNDELRRRVQDLIDELRLIENEINDIMLNIQENQVETQSNGFRYIETVNISLVNRIDITPYKLIKLHNVIKRPNYYNNDPFFMNADGSKIGGVFGLTFLPASHFAFEFLPGEVGTHKLLFGIVSPTEFTYQLLVQERTMAGNLISVIISDENISGLSWIYGEFTAQRTDVPIVINLYTSNTVAINYFNIYDVNSEDVGIFTHNSREIDRFFVFGPKMVFIFDEINEDHVGIKYTKGTNSIYHYRGLDFYMSDIKMEKMREISGTPKIENSYIVPAPRTIIVEPK